MRILLVNKFHYRKGGAETYYLTVGSELEHMGHEVAYFSMKHPDNLPCKWDKYFVTQREYNNVKNPLKAARDGMALIYSPEAKCNFQALCEEFRPDVVHLNNVHRQITLSILDAPYLRENKVPVLYTAHDYVTVCPGYLMLDGGGRVCDACLEDGRYRHCIERRCVKGSRAKSALAAMEASFNRAHKSNRRIDRVIAPSRFMCSKLIEGGWPEDKVVFVQNYNCSYAEHIIPAADISEQISLASKEASGTGNMKFMLNGALTLGTMDGANVEIAELVGNENIFTFGEDSQTVIDRYARGDYNSRSYYEKDSELKRAVDFIVSDTVKSVGCSENLERLYNELLNKDWFMTFPDFEEYIATREKAYTAYTDRKAWAKKALINISKAGFFSSDRTIEQYNKEIWKLS